MNKIIHFIKYNNSFTIILGILFLATGSVFASETVRDAVIGQRIVEVGGVDNSALLVADLDSYKQGMSIRNTTEDEENYFVTYDFNTMDIADNVWKNVNKSGVIKVSRAGLGSKDLGLYVQGELGQIMDGQMVYLKKVQEKELAHGRTQVTETVKYTGLKGLVYDSETKKLEGYEPVVKEAVREVAPAPASMEGSLSSGNMPAAEPAPVEVPLSSSADETSPISASTTTEASPSTGGEFSPDSSITTEATSTPATTETLPATPTPVIETATSTAL